MAVPPRSPGRAPTTATPRWVKVAGLLVAVLILLVLVMLLLPGGHGGDHGPARHGLGGGTGDRVGVRA